jgi:hypothetical protein
VIQYQLLDDHDSEEELKVGQQCSQCTASLYSGSVCHKMEVMHAKNIFGGAVVALRMQQALEMKVAIEAM